MINDINAQSREHIFYDTLKGVLLYHNDLANYPLHWHNEVELILVLSGSLKVKFHNDSSAVVDCMPGDIMMIAPGTLHEYISEAPGGEKLILLFDLATYSQVSSLVPLIKTLPPYTHISQNLYPVEVARLQNYFWEIDRLYGQQDEFLQISVYSLVSLILAQIGSMHLNDAIINRDAADSQHKNIDKLVEVTNYIDSHRSDDLTVEQLADLAGQLIVIRGGGAAVQTDGDVRALLQLFAAQPQIILILDAHHQVGFGFVQRGDQPAQLRFDFFLGFRRYGYGDFGIDERHVPRLLNDALFLPAAR